MHHPLSLMQRETHQWTSYAVQWEDQEIPSHGRGCQMSRRSQMSKRCRYLLWMPLMVADMIVWWRMRQEMKQQLLF